MSFYGFHMKSAKQLLEIFPRSKSGNYKRWVDVTITSPPYWNLKNYDSGGQIGYGQSYDEYLDDLGEVFSDVYKITKDSGSLWIVIDTFKKKRKDRTLSGIKDGELVLLPIDVTNKVKASGWKLQDICIWEKDKTLPWSRKGQLRNIFEYILFFTKTGDFKFYVDRIRISDPAELKEWWVKYPERYNPKGAVPTDVWKYAIPVQGSWARGFMRHFCPFPVEMVERIILLTTNQGNTVLDPFAGSGVVLAVAESMSRRYIGFETKKEYVDHFPLVKEKIKEEMVQRIGNQKGFQRVQVKLKDLNHRLRLMKFPKTLAKRLYSVQLADGEKFPVNTIFAISRGLIRRKGERNDFKFLKEDLMIVLDGDVLEDSVRAHILRTIEKISSSPPLSKYGIDPRVFLYSRNEFVKKHLETPLFDSTELWIYIRGVVNKFESRIDFEEWRQLSSKPEWKNFFRNNVPPVISNVKVHQEVIKTWKRRQT